MSARLDLARIAELGEVLGGDLATIVTSLLQSMEATIEALARALADGNVATATQTAHACRNDAVIVGAAPLLAALTDVETACRDDRLDAARDGFERVAEAWPATRAQLQRAAGTARRAE